MSQLLHPAEGSPLDSQRQNTRRFASRVPKTRKVKGMKNRKGKDGGRSAARQWVTMRVSLEEKKRLVHEAGIAGLPVSELMRRRYFGGRPLVALTDGMMVRELRRVGGLFKHNFETLRQGKVDPEWGQKQEYALQSLADLIAKIGAAYRHDRQEN